MWRWRRRTDDDFSEEIQANIALDTDRFIAEGMAPEEARAAAHRAFGNVTRAQERFYESRRMIWVDDVRRDLGYAVRTLRKSPGFAILGVVVMALGIGANAAVFSVVNAVLLKPLPYFDPDRIVTVSSSSLTNQALGSLGRQVSAPDFEDWDAQAASFEAMALYATREAAVTIGQSAVYGRVSRVSRDFFRVFAVQPAVGRLFTEGEKTLKTRAAIVSHAFAQGHFGASGQAVGQTIRLSDSPVEVVGVLPMGLEFPDKTEIWAPFNPTSNTNRGQRNFLAVGRLKAEASPERAQAEIGSITARLEQQYPQTNRGRSAVVTRLHEHLVGDVRLMLYLLLAAVGLVLCLACANMATLLLARATARTPEIAVRTALGAGRGRIVRQMLVEGISQGLIAAAAGLMLAWGGTKALVALAPGDVPRLADVVVDGPVLVFTLAVSVIASLLLALAPAFQAARVDVEQALRQGATRAVASGRTRRVREGLVVVQIAMAVVLLTTGGLLIKSFVALQNVPLGFRPENVLVMEATVLTPDPRQGATLFFRDLLAEVSRLPGVMAAGATMMPPGRVDASGSYSIDYWPDDLDRSTSQVAVLSIVSPGTFAALGIPVTHGRDFDDRDTREGRLVAIVNETLARQTLPGQDLLGHRIFCSFDSDEPMTIVGIVGDVRQSGPAREARPECYMPYLQHFYNGGRLSLVMRTAIEPTALAETVRRQAQDLSPAVPVRFTTMEALTAQNVAAPRFRAFLVGIFAAVALVLAVVGVFGVMAYVVGQRTSEIGLRVALGATPSNVLWLLFRRGLALTVVGLTLGLVGAAVATRFIESLLFGVYATDPITYLSVAALLGLTSLAALYIPARRAMKVDPMVALRCE